jgi:CheY-like chemotaxis protein
VESVDLNAAVHESMAMLTPSLGSDVTTTLRLEAAHHVDADPTQLNQLIVNLCLNASEAMPAGGTLAVGTRDVLLDAATCVPWELAPGPYVELTVTDSGVGMTDEVRQRIFEPFFTTKTGGTIGGSGLGLPTVYGVVHLHRGAIKVDSAAGEGATFTVLLPKGTLAAPDVAADPAVPGGGGLVLVVEDEAMLRQLATTALTHLGYRALTAGDGVEGVDLFRAHHHELAGVLLDLKMPRKSGRETFTEMRAIDANVPVLLCSGYGDNEEAQGLISLGAIGLLPKPYRIGELAEQISRFKR